MESRAGRNRLFRQLLWDTFSKSLDFYCPAGHVENVPHEDGR